MKSLKEYLRAMRLRQPNQADHDAAMAELRRMIEAGQSEPVQHLDRNGGGWK